MRVKSGDTHEVSWQANADLVGASIRLIAKASDRAPVMLDVELGDTPGLIRHRLTGLLPVGAYRIELEVFRDGITTTFPNEGYATLTVLADLD
ncbi:hypothetical protein [uncultured Microbacterium sp.]|uniref:hypothetical protein n=1 Tax=uncultured Microbacterium sp. TaxID=191216 RepID=UPI0025DE70A8|nr:hypothetical protein [uncultured Microbacterium sp.]